MALFAEAVAASVRESTSSRICDSPILVTGGTGFVAGHLIQQLLQRGYRVRATLRDSVYADSEQFAYLSRLQLASELLEFVPLDLMTDSSDSSWQSAFADVEYVMHVAGPTALYDEDPQANIINPIIQGTQTILSYCKGTPTVKKLILTSCMSAMTDIFEPGKKYDESCWNETATSSENIYSYSKTTAEREAQRTVMNDDASFQVVSILPGTILGAHLGKRMSQSHHFFKNLTMRNGRSRGIMNVSLAISDVRDVARFHIAAMERDSHDPMERFLCANIAMPLERILQIVHENIDDLVVPTRKVGDFLVKVAIRRYPDEQKNNILNRLSKPPVFSRQQLKSLGVPLRTPAESVVDTCRYFIENNIVNFVDDSKDGACIIL